MEEEAFAPVDCAIPRETFIFSTRLPGEEETNEGTEE